MEVEASDRPLRADAERNRHKLLTAAHAVFAERGLDAGVDEVARAAGVGMGTLYRRFPTKDALVEAVIEDRFDRLVAALSEHASIDDPWESFATCAETLAQAIAEDQAFFQVVSESIQRHAHMRARRDEILAALEPVVARAQKARVLRRDVAAGDIPGLCAVAARLPRWRLAEQPGLWRRYLAIVLDGLRPEGATRLPE
jgi:AcrR family transcriptional regulator